MIRIIPNREIVAQHIAAIAIPVVERYVVFQEGLLGNATIQRLWILMCQDVAIVHAQLTLFADTYQQRVVVLREHNVKR
jgi:hypothetical protein